MSLTTFPFETDKPQVDVVLPLGAHVLKLVVTDDTGTESQPDAIVVNVRPAPVPTITSIMPDRVFKGATVDAVLYGASLTDVTGVKVFRDAHEDDRIVVTVREGGAGDTLPISIMVMDHAHAGARTLVVTTAGGTATVGFKVLSAEGVRIRAITPQSGSVGGRQPIAVRIDGDNLEDVTEVAFLRHKQADANISTVLHGRHPDYVDADISISVNAVFGARTLLVKTPIADAYSPPGVGFTVLPGLLQFAIMALTLITAVIHLTLNYPNPLFILNGLGYIILLGALYAPIYGPLARRRPLVRWVLLAYTLLTIILWLATGSRTPLAYITKIVEALLALMLLYETRQP